MPKNLTDKWPEVFVSDSTTTLEVSKALKQGNLRKLASRLYTSNLTDAPEAIVKRHLWTIVAGYFPNALIADRTALENAPAPDGSVCLITEEGQDISLPGITLRPRRGHPPLSDDRPFVNGLYLCSFPRAVLENVRSSRARSGKLPRTLTKAEIEVVLEQNIRQSGEDGLNRLRDSIKAIAPQLGLQKEAALLTKMVSAFLGTYQAGVFRPASSLTKARMKGLPYDPQRMERFAILHKALRNTAPVFRQDTASEDQARQNIAFFEAYFSNFIEGTEFEVSEAFKIVFEGKIPAQRPQDAHDVLGTFQIVADTARKNRIPQNFEDFIAVLRKYHALIMESRPEKSPGIFKSENNRAGLSIFVAPELVAGTLKQGFDLYLSLEPGFARAVFMMFLVAEVHPFADGNGRMARVMMNAELVANQEQRIIIPTVYRNNYLVALKALTHSNRPEPFIRVMDFAQKWTASIDWKVFDNVLRQLEASHAFVDSGLADEDGIRLVIP
jgi:hypothetical protein